jgi:hypothetical protein
MGTLATMGCSGDTKVIWDADNADEVAAAQRTFDDLKKKGFLAFAVTGAKGAKGDQIREFDPEAERIIMAPPMQGG